MFKKLEMFDHHFIDEFYSLKDAVDYAVEHYNVKATMLSKYKFYKNVRVEKCND